MQDLIRTLHGHRIACDLVERDAMYYATNTQALRQLRTEFRLRSRAGFPCEWLSPADARQVTGIATRGAILTSGNAQFDPYKACVGLMRAARSAGAEIYERSPVRRIVHTRELCGSTRLHGHIDAGRVIIATGYATRQFRPLAGRFRMYRTYVLATPPLNHRERRNVGLGNVMVWDTERPYHYARWTSDYRLLLGGADRPSVADRRDPAVHHRHSRVARRLRTLLPALSDIGIERAWEGVFALTPDSLPFMGPHRKYPGHLFALGYGGNGMTFGSLAARLQLEHWRGERSTDQRLFHFSRLR